MTRAEFLESLRRALNGNMSAAAVEDNIQFYNGYFSSQTAQGRSEQDVLRELGDPRILARTLIDAAERAGDMRAREANETQYRTSGYRAQGGGASNAAGRDPSGASLTQDEGMREHRVFRIPGWLIALAVVLILFAVVSVVGSLIWVLLPYAVPVILVVYIVKLIGRR